MGRKKLYSEEELMKLVEEVAIEYPEKKITYVLLEKATNVPRHIWRNTAYTEMQTLIQRINRGHEIKKIKSLSNYKLPNLLNDLDNDDMLTVAEKHMNIERELLSKVIELDVINKNLVNENSELMKEIKELRIANTKLTKQVNECYVLAQNPKTRDKNNLKRPNEMFGNSELNKQIGDLLL